MGNSQTAQQQYSVLLHTLLKSSWVKVKKSTMIELELVNKHCYWFHPPGKTALNLKVWIQVLRVLRRAHQQGVQIPLSVWSLCNLISLALEPLQSESEESVKWSMLNLMIKMKMKRRPRKY